ncbi:MAG: hypothetical protein MUF64_29750 [Polyangiaceae bacterium]|jgi:hypothetical protein|nr:hypothetical protein [Polyangiaceae bacterium]
MLTPRLPSLLPWLLALIGAGCGGSSSETPFPQSAHEVAAIPVLQRSQRPKQRPAPTPNAPDNEDSDPR